MSFRQQSNCSNIIMNNYSCLNDDNINNSIINNTNITNKLDYKIDENDNIQFKNNSELLNSMKNMINKIELKCNNGIILDNTY